MLPGPVDMAALSFKYMQQYIKEPGIVTGYTYPDGVRAPFSNFPPVTHPLSESERTALLADAAAQKNKVFAQSEKRRKEKGEAVRDVTELPADLFSPTTSIGWVADNKRILVFRMVGDSFTKWRKDFSEADSILKIRSRPLYDIPEEPGLCMPYIFVPDMGSGRRNMRMSYRLKDHPDIQITLTDSSAFNPRGEKAYEKDEAKIRHQNKLAEPDPEIATFWEQWMTVARKYDSQWLLPPYTRPVNMAGFEGRQSFVRLTMDDGTQNYGYYAVVRGNPDATVDTPDIRLFVEQDVKLAQGKTPLTKEQFIEMAQAIAKSVQRRPTAAN